VSGAPGYRVTAGAARAAGPAEVSWFDIREVTLGPADLAGLDARETARAAAFVFPADRHRYQVAHVMLRRVLAGHLGTEPGRLTFGRQPCPACGGPSGRPVLAWGDDPPGTPRGADGAWPASRQAPSRTLARGDTQFSGDTPDPDGPGTPRGADGAWPASRQAPSRTLAGEGGGPGDRGGPGPSFSLARSGEAVAIAVAAAPVGIDVERQASGCVCSLASAMHPDDAALVQALPEPDRHLAVIRWWVRAEAVLKCAGTGIAHGMDAFPVLGTPAPGRVPPVPRPPAGPDAAGWATAAGCSLTALPAPEGYQAALALPGPRPIRYRQGSGGR